MAKKDWQVGPVLKEKAGSQGTLFRGGTAYSSDKRYPRGYTPERRDEVAEAVVRPSVQNYTQQPQQVFKGTQSGFYKDRKVRASGDMSAPMVHDSAQPVRNLVDTIARSTVPVEHLSGVQFRTNASEAQLGPKAAAHHSVAGDALSKGQPVIRMLPGVERDGGVVAHEIGHHVSDMLESPWRANYGHHTSEGGREEAFADNYAEVHARDRKGREVNRGTYGGGQFAGHIERSDQFWDGYRSNRHYKPDGYIETENRKYYRAFPEEEVHPDGSQDVPLVHKEREYGEYVNGKQQVRDRLGDINDDAIPSHTNFDWSRYRG